jgi:hypothetical protein
MGILKAVLVFLRAMPIPKLHLAVENLALRQQLPVCKPSTGGAGSGWEGPRTSPDGQGVPTTAGHLAFTDCLSEDLDHEALKEISLLGPKQSSGTSSFGKLRRTIDA